MLPVITPKVQLMQSVHGKGFANTGLTLILGLLSFGLLIRFIPRHLQADGETTMNALKTFFAAFLNRRNNAGAARQLFERAGQARGLSKRDAAELRGNAMAVLRVVR